jgi:outer membrane cobalamin receptor
MKRTGVIIGILWQLILLDKIFAQDVDLEKIVVISSRIEENYADISRKVDLITSKDIESSSARDLSEVLTEITSVNISDYGGLGATKTIRMRGSTAAQVLVLVDGRPINNPRDGEAELNSIPLENIDRIEVMHGPASSLYGAAAMGGTVNIITKKPPKEKQKTEFTTSFGTFRTYMERLSHGGRLSKLGYIITGEYESSEGFRDNSDFCAKDFNTKFEYALNSDNNLTLNSGFYRSKVGTPGKITEFDIDDKQKSLKNYFDLNWSFRPDTTMGLSTKIYQNYDRLEFIENTAGSVWDIAFNKAIHTTKVNGIDIQLNKQLTEKYLGICGFNYVTNTNDSTSTAKHKYTVRAWYLENHLDLFKNLKVSLGTRIDDYSNFGTEVNPSFSFLYKFSENNKLHGLISRSFRAPTFNDLYWPDEGWAKGNPNLKPEKGITGELGIEAKPNKYLLMSIAYYRNDFNELINWAEEGGIWQPTNIGSAVIEGAEFKNKIYLMSNFELDLDYTYLRAKNDKTHRYLIYQPKHKFDCSLKYKDLKGFVFELNGQFTDKRFHCIDDPFLSTIKVKRFFILGLNVSKKFKPGIIYFMSIDNLLNKKYQVINDYPMPGFAISNSIKLVF